MEKRSRTFTTAVALIGFGFGAAAQTASVESRLLAEPMWLLQDAEGGAKQVWFERRGGGLHLVRCATDPGCSRPVTVSPQGVRVQGITETLAVWPARATGALTLVPAWVVPVSSHDAGH